MSEEASYEAWQSDDARKLLDVYYKAKKRALSGGASLKTPAEWAGSLLVIHGGNAIEKLRQAPKMGLRIPKTSKIKKLLTAAMNAEFAHKHGTVTCHACDRRATPTLAWRFRSDENGETIWACAHCAISAQAPPS